MNVKELFDLNGKTAIVTGGGRGLGEQIAFALAESGANIIVCSRKLEDCEFTSYRVRELGVQSLALKCDVSNSKDVNNVVEETIKKFGTIDILVNNSGATWGTPLEDMPIEKWNKVMNVNVTGTFLMTQAVGRIMIKQKSGKIINISSISGLGGISEDIMDAVGYNASKGAIITLTKDLAVKWGKYNIHVNSIAPGFFLTKMAKSTIESKKALILANTPLNRTGSEHDLKGAAVFLASKASDFVTGTVLVVDGGFTEK
ncbi:SDR family oxidoreductase [Bacillus sp. FJAT-29814]|uniref:SDR family oxidoreductase n=1 Tax=Bacillus sp. FJAT-29814 TaxID=1729688 RepID=UPI00082EEF61|nr:SDR family oxidoreductase [Bacillus sp. FJAT-29814]